MSDDLEEKSVVRKQEECEAGFDHELLAGLALDDDEDMDAIEKVTLRKRAVKPHLPCWQCGRRHRLHSGSALESAAR